MSENNDYVVVLLEKLRTYRDKLHKFTSRPKNLNMRTSMKLCRARNKMKYSLAIKRGKNSPESKRNQRRRERRKNSE